MSILPTIPRDPAARLRLLSLWFALFATFIVFIEIGIGTSPVSSRMVGVTADLLLASWLVWGYKRGHFPEFSTPVDALLLVAAGAASSMPLRAMGLWLAALQLRALYVSRREFWLLPLSYGVARVAALALTSKPAPYDAFSPTVFLQGVGLLIICGTMFLLMAALERAGEKERALERSEERFRLLAAATHDMVYEWNVATDAVEHTDAIRTVFGFTDADVVRDRFWWLSRIHPSDRAGYDAAVVAMFASPTGVASAIRYRIRQMDGSTAMVVESAVVQRDASGAATRVIGSVRDVTSQEQLEEQLRQAQKMEAVGQLAGGAAHDFNNLLTVIGGHVFMLEETGDVSIEATRHLEGITRAAERAGALTRQLLAFGRKQVMRPTIVNLNTVANDVVRLILPLVGERVRVITALDPAVASVVADPGQLEQVLINLAINARDAMPGGGTLTVATANSADGRHVELSIRDTGSGMDASVQAHLFEPFFTTKPPGKGTGLGLATAYGIIKQSLGDIAVESAVGKGSTFTISLPVSIGTAAELAAATRSPSPFMPLPSAKRVLLVEDDDEVRAFAREVLSRGGFEVLSARHGLDGIAMAKSHDYAIDLVVTDVVMPEMGGLQMVEQLRGVRPDLRVLYVSGYADDAIARRELGSADATLLEKPFTARGLREAVDGVGVL